MVKWYRTCFIRRSPKFDSLLCFSHPKSGSIGSIGSIGSVGMSIDPLANELSSFFFSFDNQSTVSSSIIIIHHHHHHHHQPHHHHHQTITKPSPSPSPNHHHHHKPNPNPIIILHSSSSLISDSGPLGDDEFSLQDQVFCVLRANFAISMPRVQIGDHCFVSTPFKDVSVALSRRRSDALLSRRVLFQQAAADAEGERQAGHPGRPGRVP